MVNKDKIILLYEIYFIHSAVEALKLSKIDELPHAIEVLEDKIDQLWQTIEKYTKGATDKYYNKQIKEQRLHKGMKMTIVPPCRPPNKSEKKTAQY